MVYVKDFNNYINTISPETNILLLGKGPSFSLLDKVNLEKFLVVCLNHTIRNVDECEIASIIDIEIFNDADEEVYNKAKYLAMPWRPHKGLRPTQETILDFSKQNDFLKKFIDEKRVLLYNTDRAEIFNLSHVPNIPVNNLGINNGDSLFDMFCKNLKRETNKTIYSIGIDGGSGYSEEFDGLKSGDEYSRSIANIKKIESNTNFKMEYLKNLIK